jgi:hypothetical protein
MRHRLPATHVFGVLSVADERHSHGSPAGQSESLKHSSYEHPTAQRNGEKLAGKQRPLVP